jgi:Ni/Fe-hydrogenase subunit HybB-like protein
MIHYVISTIWWFISHIGDKHRMHSPWWEAPLVAPVFVIAAVMGFLYSRFG